MNTATRRKRRELLTYIQREVVPKLSIQGVVEIGSVARGIARDDSDIDAVVFLAPYDLYAIPAEFKWSADQGTYHGIFREVENSIQLDFQHLDLAQWSKKSYPWPESICAELSEGWIAFDRNDEIQTLIAKRTKYNSEVRQGHLDEAIVGLASLLSETATDRTWTTLGPSIAHYRLHSACDYLIQALFAYNRRWRPLRSREISVLLCLPWIPEGFEEQLLLATNALTARQERYQERAATLRDFFDKLVSKCQQDRLYGENAVREAFIRQHDEPGRSWNMDEWKRKHEERNLETQE